MKKIIASLSVLCLAAGMLSAQDGLTLVVGTFTRISSRGVYTYTFDQQSGSWSPLDTLDLRNPAFLAFSEDGTRMYAVNENEDGTDAVSAVAFDAAKGSMQLLGQEPTQSAGPCYVSTDGNIVVAGTYAGGALCVFPLEPDGSLKPMSQQFKGSLGGPDPTHQNEPHVHCAQFTPDGKYVIATDFSADRLIRFKYSSRRSTLKPAKELVKVSSDSGPRHFIFSQDGRFIYVMSELSGAVTVLRHRLWGWRKVQEIASDTVGGRGGADIHLSPDGKFLYSSNRLKDDGIAIFSVDGKNGRLTRVGYQRTGEHPRNFGISPNGKYLLCACRYDDVIQVYSIDPQTGLLTDTGNDIPVPEPVCVKFRTY